MKLTSINSLISRSPAGVTPSVSSIFGIILPSFSSRISLSRRIRRSVRKILSDSGLNPVLPPPAAVAPGATAAAAPFAIRWVDGGTTVAEFRRAVASQCAAQGRRLPAGWALAQGDGAPLAAAPGATLEACEYRSGDALPVILPADP